MLYLSKNDVNGRENIEPVLTKNTLCIKKEKTYTKTTCTLQIEHEMMAKNPKKGNQTTSYTSTGIFSTIVHTHDCMTYTPRARLRVYTDVAVFQHTHTHTLTDVVLLTAAVVVALREELVSGLGFGRLKALLLLYVLAWSDDHQMGRGNQPILLQHREGRHSLTH